MKMLLFVFLFHFGFGQNVKPSFAEKKWAFFHPFAAIKIKRIYKQCNLIYETVQKKNILDQYSAGGELDAYRHSFYMAAFAQKIKLKKLRRLGQLHEKNNYKTFKKARTEFGELPDSLSSVMDLSNNELGFKIGKEFKKTPLNDLSEIVLKEIKSGKAFKMKRNTNGDYLDCDGKIINLIDYKNIWNVPKCLVKT